MNAMPAKQIMFSLFFAVMILLPPIRANAGELDIQTSNVQMSIDDNGDIVIKTAPVSPVIVNPIVNPPVNRRRIRSPRANNTLKCRNVTQRRSSIRGNNRIFTQNTTSICN
jgi:hypothetical protein